MLVSRDGHKMTQKWNLFLKEINSFILNVTDQCVIYPATSEGGVPAILNIMCMFIRHESEAQSLSPHYNKKVGKHFSIPSVPFPFAPLSSPGWRVCPHLCWDNLLEYPDFPSLICLKEINGHYVAKLIPNRNCHYLVSQLIELTQGETPPKAVPDLIITIQWDMKHKTDNNHFDTSS